MIRSASMVALFLLCAPVAAQTAPPAAAEFVDTFEHPTPNTRHPPPATRHPAPPQ